MAPTLGSDYYTDLLAAYRERRDYLLPALAAAGFAPYSPAGAYYIIADISRFGYADDVSFARHLVQDVGLAVVPGSSFFPTAEEGAALVRFAFPKRLSTLARAVEKLHQI